MRDIVGNHVALVEEGRAGPDVYVSDSNPLEFSTMKHAALANAFFAALAINADTVTADQRLALDAAIEKEMKAEDEDDEDAKKKKIAKDATPPEAPKGGAPKPAMDASLLVAAVDAAFATKDYITRSQAVEMANDAATSAVKRVNELHKAREAVKPLVGVVAFDSAEEVYGFALKESKVNVEGVPTAAYPALVDQVLQRRASTVTPINKAKTVLANDGKTPSINSVIPGLGRINVQ
jgi:LysM repeat protein